MSKVIRFADRSGRELSNLDVANTEVRESVESSASGQRTTTPTVRSSIGRLNLLGYFAIRTVTFVVVPFLWWKRRLERMKEQEYLSQLDDRLLSDAGIAPWQVGAFGRPTTRDFLRQPPV